MSCFCKAQSLCHCRLGRAGTRVMGASVAGGMGSQAPVPLLPHYLFPWTLLWLSGWSCVCHLSCCCSSGLHCYGQRAVSTDTLSVVPSVPPPLCDPIHLPLDEQLCGILQDPGVLGSRTFVGLWMFEWL